MLTLNFFGDFVIETSTAPCFCEKLKDLIDNADYNIINYEAPVTPECPKPVSKSGPSLSQPVYSAAWLIENGFNVFSLANNHIMDYGTAGLKMTINAIEKSVQYLGVGSWDEAYKPLVLEKDGIKVALFSMTELQFGVLHNTEQADIQGCAWINHPSVNNLIQKTKRQVDYIVVMAHAGLEGEDIPLPEWRNRYRELIDNGCDVIIGGHTHTPQGYEIYKGKYIFYSLGNFYFEKEFSKSPKWHMGECVTLDVYKDKISCRLHGTNFMNHRIELTDSEQWNNTLQPLNEKLTMNYWEQINEICLRKLQHYNNLFSAGAYIHIDRYLLKSIARYILGRCNELHVLNNLQCETHRWTIGRAIRIRNKIM